LAVFITFPVLYECTNLTANVMVRHILFLSVLSIIYLSHAMAQSVDVAHYEITLDISDLSSKAISGNCELTLESTEDHDSFELDLEGLRVDSVLDQGGTRLAFSHEGVKLKIEWKSPFMVGSAERKVKVFYGGKPKRDASWGGFYFSGEYAFNLGVAFTSDPHNFGRIWYPCIDNFTDRATYVYTVTTDTGMVARCNGTLVETKDLGGTLSYKWVMDEPIPTYLSSVAVGPYEVYEYEHLGIPVSLASHPDIMEDMKASFVNLDDAITAFVNGYGAHNFSKIGYNAVPFNAGAMEHATNIAYPIYACDGTTNSETLHAHEVAHHWWGNSVTCRTQEDMWINEGWARYSESLFLEEAYGKERYRDNVSHNHWNVVHHAHMRDGAALPVSGIGHSNTYGDHVYNKGGDMVHTLRGIMGDEKFFEACNTFISMNKFSDVNSDDLKTHFQQYTTADLDAFFKHWIYQPGFCHFDILDWSAKPNGEGFDLGVRIRQRTRLAPELFDGVPMVLSIFDKNMNREDHLLTLGGKDKSFEISSKLDPVYLVLDLDEKISDAVSDRSMTISDTGSYDFGDAMMDVEVTKVSGDALMRVAHHWVTPDQFFKRSELPFISKERYWTVEGVWPEEFEAKATIEYNGRRTGTNYAIGYLDVDLIRITEDSLKLFYRPHPSGYWEEYTNYSLETGSKFDRKGLIHIRDLKRGEYVLAMNDARLLSSDEVLPQKSNYGIKVYPNPGKAQISIDCSGAKGGMLEITDLQGRLIYCKEIRKDNTTVSLDTTSWKTGYYFAGIVLDCEVYEPVRFVIRQD